VNFRVVNALAQYIVRRCSVLTLPSGDDETIVLAVPDFFEMTGKRTFLLQ